MYLFTYTELWIYVRY